MSLAYLVLCHQQPRAAAELLQYLWRPEDLFVLHVDAKASADAHEIAAALAAQSPRVRVLPSELCSWGGWSLVAATLHGLELALTEDPAWSHFVLLGETHLPLHAPDEIDARLQPGVSYLEDAPLATMPPWPRRDVMHRFDAKHRELPGVGMFPVAAGWLDPEIGGALHHSSQWVILARDACRLLATMPPPHPFWDSFRTALLADETALPTALRGGLVCPGLTLQAAAPTFTAWPKVSGTADMSFTEANFIAAREQGRLFIRKRPPLLPPAAAEALRLRREWILPAPTPAPTAAPSWAGEVAAALAAAARAAGLPPPEPVPPQPACHLRLRSPAWRDGLSVRVLSQDGRLFKSLLLWEDGDHADLGRRTLGGYPAIRLKLRQPDLFLAREIVLPELAEAGFVTLDDLRDVTPLVGVIARQARVAARLSAPAAAGQAASGTT